MKIGDKEIVYSTGLIVPADEEAQVDFIVAGERVLLNIQFKEENGSEKNISRIDTEVVDNRLRLTFVNWNSSLGTATTEPMRFAALRDGRPVFLMVVNWSIGTTKKIDLQCLLGQEDS